MRRIITLSLLFIAGIVLLGIGSILVRRSQNAYAVSKSDQTRTSVYLLNDGYLNGPTVLPGYAIDARMTMTATTRGTDTAALVEQTAIAFATEHAGDPGSLTFSTGQAPMTYRVTFTEAEMNILLPQYIPADANIQTIEFHFTEAGVNLNATAKTFGLSIDASAAARLSIQDGNIVLDVQEATIAGIRPPQAAINAVMEQVVGLIQEALTGALGSYTADEPFTLTDITTTEGSITIAFIQPTPQPE